MYHKKLLFRKISNSKQDKQDTKLTTSPMILDGSNNHLSPKLKNFHFNSYKIIKFSMFYINRYAKISIIKFKINNRKIIISKFKKYSPTICWIYLIWV